MATHLARSVLGSLLLIIAFAPKVTAQADDAPSFSRALNVSQFRSAGLHKLTDTELKNLDRLARAYAQVLGGLAMSTRPGPVTAPSATVIESRIDGEFQGWEGETIFKLMNGQIWQQASYAYHYHYAYAPKVLIYRSGTVFKMKVDGVDAEIVVRRLK